MGQGISKKCYVHIERLPQHMIKNTSVKVEIKKEISSQEMLNYDEIKTENHDDLNDAVYKETVSLILKIFFIKVIKMGSEIKIITYYFSLFFNFFIISCFLLSYLVN